MKIDDVIVGKNYGAIDEPSRSRYSSSTNPRQVKVLEIVTDKEPIYSNYSRDFRMRNVRRVKVQFLDEGKLARSYLPIAKAEKGSTLTVHARQLVGTWADLSPAVHARVREEQAKLDVRASIESRLRATGFGKALDNGEVYVRVFHSGRPEIEFRGGYVEKLLAALGARVESGA